MTLKQDPKAIKQLTKEVLSGKKQLKTSQLQKIGVQIHGANFLVGNVAIEKNILADSYYISSYDPEKDIDGNSIATNKKLQLRIINLFEAGKKSISKKELLDFRIITSATSLEIGNARLTNILGLGRSFDISLADETKTIDGRWKDQGITIKKVIDSLLNFPFGKKQLALNEVPLNKELENYLKMYFETVKKSDSSKKGLLDLTIGNGKSTIAIEMKIARQLAKTGNRNACIGQIGQYHQQFGSNLILLIAGTNTEMAHKNIGDCIKEAKKLNIEVFKMMG